MNTGFVWMFNGNSVNVKVKSTGGEGGMGRQ